jgi:hypothetical protein
MTFTFGQLKKLPKIYVNIYIAYIFRVAKAVTQVVKQFKVHAGGFLPLFFAGLASLVSLVGGAAAVTKTMPDEKKNLEQFEEFKGHNLAMGKKKVGTRL